MLYDSSRSLNSRLLPPGPNPSLSPSPHLRRQTEYNTPSQPRHHLRRQTGARESGLGTFLRCFAVRHWPISGVSAHRPAPEQPTKHTRVRLFGKTINSEPPGKQTRRKTGNQANNQTKKRRQATKKANKPADKQTGRETSKTSVKTGRQSSK